jgi:hypothetical protein
MARLVSIAMLANLSSPAQAAGDTDMPVIFDIGMLMLVGLSSVGTGFFLQGLMRLRNALLLIGAGVLFLEAYAVSIRGLSRTIEFTPFFAFLLLLFASLFAAGWYFGKWAAKRQMKRQTHA